MKELKTTHKFEKAVVLFLNTFDDWKLKHTGVHNELYDAEGLTPKGKKCVIEMKFRKKYYDTKMIEVTKFDELMALNKDIVKIFFVSDPKGTYMFWLDGIKDFKKIKKYCPNTTYWNARKKKKEVYLLPESVASYVYLIDD